MPEQPYSVRFVGTEKAIPAGLWAACFPPPVEGHWWYRALEASGLEHQFQFLYGLIEHDGRPVGIAPMFTMRIEVEFLVPDALIPFLALIGKLLPSLSAPTGLFIGSPCSDEGTVGLLPDVDRRGAFLALQKAAEAEAARRGAGLVAWKDFPASEEADLAWLAQRAGLFRLADFPGTVVALPGPRKEDYLAQLSTSRRHNLKRKLKRSAQAFQPLVEVVQSPDAATLDEIYGLFEQTRARAKTTFEDLGRSFFENVARERVSHFIILASPRHAAPPPSCCASSSATTSSTSTSASTTAARRTGSCISGCSTPRSTGRWRRGRRRSRAARPATAASWSRATTSTRSRSTRSTAMRRCTGCVG